MADEPKNDPAKRLRRLLNGGKSPAVTKLPKKDVSAVINLPPKGEDANPTQRTKLTLPPALKTGPSFRNMMSNLGPPFWTIASAISLTVNVVLLIVLLVAFVALKNSGFKVSNMVNLGSSFLGGLYSNFEKMDRASITSDVKVDTTIPVKFDLQLNQQTNVVLSQDVTISNALVTVNTGGLNITRANTTIVLPQGTILPIVLNLTVPVNTTVPVTLNVPVNIPLNQTQLHEPFTGLQEVVKPFYCMLAPSAVNLDNQAICQ